MQNYVRNAIVFVVVIVIVVGTIFLTIFFERLFLFICLAFFNVTWQMPTVVNRYTKSVLKFVNLGRILFFFSWKLKNWHRELYQMNRNADVCHANVSMFNVQMQTHLQSISFI